MLSVPCRTSNLTKNFIINFSKRSFSGASSVQLNLQVNPSRTNPVRFLSSHDVFGDAAKLNIVCFIALILLSMYERLFQDIPAPPPPAPPTTSLEELVASGESVLDELGLFSWWKPSSYFRWGLEALHIHFDLPWWGAIVAGILFFSFSKLIILFQLQ